MPPLRGQDTIRQGPGRVPLRARRAERDLPGVALRGDISDSTIYITLSPCLTCAKLIINAGIKEVVYAGDYTAFLDTVKDMFRQSGVKCRAFKGKLS